MDGLRGIAMLFVFLGHFGPVWSGQTHPTGAADFFLRLIDADATFGSSFFMLLSGFFAWGSLMRRTRTFRDFLRGRIWRLYPMYLVMNAVYIAGSLLFPAMSKLPAGRGNALLFIVETMFFLPGILHVRPLMDVAWTLSFVVLFYFVEGALASVFTRWGLSRPVRFAILVTAGVFWAVTGDSTGWWDRRTAIFWMGMALSEAVEGMSGARRALAVRLVAPAVLLTILGVWLRTDLMLRRPDTGPVSLLLLRTAITSVTLVSLVWVAYSGPEPWKRLLSGPLLRQMGAASYSFYLTHGFAIKAFRFFIIPWLGPAANASPVFWTGQVAGLALSVAIAKAAWLLLENPLAKLARRPFMTAQDRARGAEEKPVLVG